MRHLFVTPLCLMVAILCFKNELTAIETTTNKYISFQNDCIEKYDYEEFGAIGQSAYSDYHLNGDNSVRYIFRVERNVSHKHFDATVHDLQSCSNLSLDKDFLNAVNARDADLYIAVPNSVGHMVSRVNEVVVMIDSDTYLSYESKAVSFGYEYEREYHPGENLSFNRGLNDLVFYLGTIEDKGKQYVSFRYFADVAEPEYTDYTFVKGVGLMKQEGQNGYMHLMSVKKPISRIALPFELVGIENEEDKTAVLEEQMNLPVLSGLSPVDEKKKKLKTEENPNIYVVKQGDNLYRISVMFNTTVVELQRINNLTDYRLDINQELWIKDPAGFKNESHQSSKFKNTSLPSENQKPAEGLKQNNKKALNQGNSTFGLPAERNKAYKSLNKMQSTDLVG